MNTYRTNKQEIDLSLIYHDSIPFEQKTVSNVPKPANKAKADNKIPLGKRKFGKSLINMTITEVMNETALNKKAFANAVASMCYKRKLRRSRQSSFANSQGLTLRENSKNKQYSFDGGLKAKEENEEKGKKRSFCGRNSSKNLRSDRVIPRGKIEKITKYLRKIGEVQDEKVAEKEKGKEEKSNAVGGGEGNDGGNRCSGSNGNELSDFEGCEVQKIKVNLKEENLIKESSKSKVNNYISNHAMDISNNETNNNYKEPKVIKNIKLKYVNRECSSNNIFDIDSIVNNQKENKQESNDQVQLKMDVSFTAENEVSKAVLNSNNILNLNQSDKRQASIKRYKLQFADEYQDDIFKHLYTLENCIKIDFDYMTKQRDINEKMREILLDWLVEVHLKFKMLPETLFITVNIIDRYLALVQVARSQLQLVGISALLIASKYEEIYPPEIKSFVYVTDNAYTKEDVLIMEENILSTLEYDLTYPSSYRYLQVLFTKMSLFNFIGNDYDKSRFFLAEYLLELTFIKIHFIKYTEFEKAIAVMSLITEKSPIEKEKLKQILNEIYLGDIYDNQDKVDKINDCKEQIRIFVRQNYDGKYSMKALYNKFNNFKYLNASNKKCW